MLDPLRVLRQKASAGQSLLPALTPKQKLIEADRWHLRCIYGSRQWGKTVWSSIAHAHAAMPGVTNLALGPTIHKVRDLLWPQFEKLNREHGAGLELRRADSQIRCRNGGVIQLLGLSTLAEAEKIRGYVPGFVTFEECGTYRDELISFAIDSCARPATMRYFRRGGRGIAALGTPSRNVKTYWHEMCLGNTGASVHFATVRDNPHIPNADAFLRQVLLDNAKKGWTESTPEFRREYKGEFCSDVESLPYGGWNGNVLPQAMVPVAGWTVLAVDFGQHHPNAWVVLRVTTERATDIVRQKIVTMHRIHLIHASQENRMTTEQVAARTKALAERFHPNVIVGDSGGGGAQTIADFQRIYNLPIVAAKKAGFKRDRIWLGGSLLENGTMLVYEDTAPWQEQARTTPWNDDMTDHHPNYPDHTLDAKHYGLEYCMAHMSEEDAEPLPGTPEYEQRETEKRWKERLDRIAEQG